MTSTIGKTVVDSNKKAATTAGIITAGDIANKQIIKLIKPKLPLAARGYADTAIGQLIVANIFNAAIKQYKPNHAMANMISEGMLVAAYAQAAADLNIESLIDDLIDSVLTDKKVMKIMATTQPNE